MKNSVKYTLIILSSLLIIFVAFIFLIIFTWSPGDPPNDQREDHSLFKNKKLKIPKEIYNLKPNLLGLFIRNYELFKDYDTSQVDDDYTIYRYKKGYIKVKNNILDTNSYYDEISFLIDDKSFVYNLLLMKNFVNEKSDINLYLKDSIHNFLKYNFNILKKNYGNNYKMFVQNGKYYIPEKLIIEWKINENYVNLRFPNIYLENSLKFYKNIHNKNNWNIEITFATSEGKFTNNYEKLQNVSHLYNPKSMGWE